MPGRNLKIFELTVNDGSALLKGKWFNQPFMKKNFKTGQEVLLCGTVRRNPYWGIGFEMDNPEYEIISNAGDSFIHMNRIVPVYRVTSGLTSRQMRSIMYNMVHTCIKDVCETIPGEILKRHALPDISASLAQVHFPEVNADVELLNRGATEFHKRLSFDELFMLELGSCRTEKGKRTRKRNRF